MSASQGFCRNLQCYTDNCHNVLNYCSFYAILYQPHQVATIVPSSLLLADITYVRYIQLHSMLFASSSTDVAVQAQIRLTHNQIFPDISGYVERHPAKTVFMHLYTTERKAVCRLPAPTKCGYNTHHLAHLLVTVAFKDLKLSADMTHWSKGNITDMGCLLALHAANGDQISGGRHTSTRTAQTRHRVLELC